MKNKFINICYPGHALKRFEVSADADLEAVFAMFNHGSGQECLPFIESKVRSLSVGDFVQIDGDWWQCKSIGWEMVKPNFVIDFCCQVGARLETQFHFCCQVGAKLETQLQSAWGASQDILWEQKNS